MRAFLVLAVALFAGFCLCVPGTAHAATSMAVFAEGPVADADLAAIRGGYAADDSSLTVRTAAMVIDADARSAFRQTGSIGRITMDIWWGSTGAELIARNVRATMP